MQKKGVIGVIGALLILAGGLALNFLKSGDDSERPEPDKVVSSNYRRAPKPNGVLQVTIRRREATLARLADMNDRGDLLYLTSKRGAKIKEYVHDFQGKVIDKRSIEEDRSFNLCPDGLLIPTRSDPVVDRISAALFPFHEDLLRPKTGPKSSILVMRRKHNPITRKDCYAVDCDIQLPSSAKLTSGVPVPISVSPPVAPAPASPPSSGSGFAGGGGGGGRGGGFAAGTSGPIDATSSTEIFRSNDPINILEWSESGNVWITEHHATKTTGSERLIRIKGTATDTVKMPDGYNSVTRLVNTGAFVAATFSDSRGKEPIRSFLRIAGSWKELPIPDGYDFSFAQKIFDNGTVLGYITKGDELSRRDVANTQTIRQVVWKGDACIILNDLPNWPKQGLVSMTLLANRRGDIYVRNVLNTQTNASEYYLLNVNVGP